MRYRELKPEGILRDYVQLIWMLEAAEPTEYPRERIVPDGIVELVFHFGTPLVTHDSRGSTVSQPRSFAISQMRHYIDIEPAGPIGLIAVRFYPWGAHHFFEAPVGAFLDATVTAGDLFGHVARDVEEEVCAAANGDARLQVIQDFLVGQLGQHHRTPTPADDLLRLVRASRGRLSIGEISRRTGFTQRRLQRIFCTSVGVAPKQFSRVTRFLNLCRHVRQHRFKSLTQLTYECGYYDQAHFIREFREFSGLTPRAFFSSDNVYFTSLDA